ncbi:hypothetical protein MEN41_16930, partial [Dolichospermum sp. ST_con]|nr:hypothetical protein [Dolichospermum sp. ST_con]
FIPHLRAEALTTKSSPDFLHYLIYFDLFSSTYLITYSFLSNESLFCTFQFDSYTDNDGCSNYGIINRKD